MPAPVSPVSTFSPGAEPQLGPLDQQEVLDAQLVEHARGCTSRARRIAAEAIGTTSTQSSVGVSRTRQPAEPLAQALVEGRARQLGEQRGRAHEADVDGLPRPQLARRAAVDVDVHRLLARGLWIVSRSPGATTSARAVSECGAMKETT